jgi:hypothetical protein
MEQWCELSLTLSALAFEPHTHAHKSIHFHLLNCNRGCDDDREKESDWSNWGWETKKVVDCWNSSVFLLFYSPHSIALLPTFECYTKPIKIKLCSELEKTIREKIIEIECWGCEWKIKVVGENFNSGENWEKFECKQRNFLEFFGMIFKNFLHSNILLKLTQKLKFIEFLKIALLFTPYKNTSQ